MQRFGGFVAKYMGDGVLVYFGYPRAHEDDAERAVRSGLELVANVGALKTYAPLQTRVGIATGLVVVGDLIGSRASQAQAIVGETPNLAARLQNTSSTRALSPSTRILPIADMKSDGQLWRRTRLRQCKYLNNIVEQDHRRIKRLVRPGLGFGSFRTARRTLAGFEAMAMMRKGQVRKIDGHDIRGQAAFIADLFDRAA
jgi:DDE domain/Adenylate and Guanylate cyclase catalytic domain